MKQKMTTEEFNEILVALQTKKNEVKIHIGVRLVAENVLGSEYFSEIPDFMKRSLCRKVLRYVAQTALKGTTKIDELASSCSFCEMKNGQAVSLSDKENL